MNQIAPVNFKYLLVILTPMRRRYHSAHLQNLHLRSGRASPPRDAMREQLEQNAGMLRVRNLFQAELGP